MLDAGDIGFWSGESSPTGWRPDWQRKNPQVAVYKAERTPSLFHVCDDRVRGIMGPVGSGKSTACCAEIMARCMRHPIDETGKRRVRAVVIRNTYRELLDTTVQTWMDWFPEETCGRFSRGDMTHEVRLLLPDGHGLELDVMFRALDRPADVRKLLSLELTFGYVNEAREIPKAVIDMLLERVGRFPSYRDATIRNAGGYWSGIWMDTNPPDEDHWWYRLFEEEKPQGWRLFRQPSGRGPDAENLQNLRPGYYQDVGGKSPEYIRVYYDGEYGFVLDGRAVYGEYTDSFHCTEWADRLPGIEIRVGMDFGLTPAAVFIQRDARGRWRVIDELVSDNMGISRFADLLASKVQASYAAHTFRFFGDPAGEQRAQTDERTVFEILRSKGIMAMPARSNDFTLRREAVAVPLMQIIDGKPGLAIHPRCRQLRKGMAGKYSYRRVQVVGDERYHDKPDKGMYSHVCEALQYGMLESGSNPRLAAGQQADSMQGFVMPQGGWSPYDTRGQIIQLHTPRLWIPQHLAAAA